jgi:hypothetical protein
MKLKEGQIYEIPAVNVIQNYPVPKTLEIKM